MNAIETVREAFEREYPVYAPLLEDKWAAKPERIAAMNAWVSFNKGWNAARTPARVEKLKGFGPMPALLEEAATVIRTMAVDEFDRLQVRHFLCDELEGSAIMLRDALVALNALIHKGNT